MDTEPTTELCKDGYRAISEACSCNMSFLQWNIQCAILNKPVCWKLYINLQILVFISLNNETLSNIITISVLVFNNLL